MKKYLNILIKTIFIYMCFIYNESYAENSKLVYLPVVFHSEGGDTLTSLCLGVSQSKYPQSSWWLDPVNQRKSPENSLKLTFSAMKQKNKKSLLELSHPDFGRDPKRFEEQVRAYFKQFEILKIVSIPTAFSFDDFFVFYVNLQINNKAAYVPFVFAMDKDGNYKFLPYRTRELNYLFVDKWFNSKWGGKIENPVYCQEKQIKKASHQYSLSLFHSNSKDVEKSVLYLTGSPFKISGLPTKITKNIEAIITEIDGVDEAENGIDNIVKHMAPKGGKKLKNWYSSANFDEKNAYIRSLQHLQPFFVFDIKPLYVVYLTSPTGIQVMYFTEDEGGQVLWINSSHITDIDKLFKKGAFYDASFDKKPFSAFSKK